jgi:hypothetical protein
MWYVGQRFVRRLFSNTRQKMATAGLEGKGWIYVDRTGRVLARNVAAMDNGADGFHTGLVRVTRDGKWGLATTRGRLAVPMSSTEFSIRMKASGAGRCERAAGRQATASTTGSRAGRGTGSIRRAGWCRAAC